MPKKVDHATRRTELAEAVLAVVAREGMDGVTIRAVAAEAGWTRGVIAHYFASREDLLLFAYREGLARVRRDLVDDPARPPLEALQEWLLSALPLDGPSSLNHEIYLGFASSATRRPDLAQVVEVEGAEFDRWTRDLLHRCIADGVLRPPTDENEAADVLIAFVEGLGLNAVTSPSRYTAARVQHLLRQFLSVWFEPCVL